MKACVLAETSAAAASLCAGARKFADEVVLIAAGVAPTLGVADKVVHIDVPITVTRDSAYISVNSVIDAENPGVVFVEPTRHLKVLAGRLAAYKKTSTITDVLEFEGDVAATMYFGGVGQRKSKPLGDFAIYTVDPSVFSDEQASGSQLVEEVAYQALKGALNVEGVEDLPKSNVNLSAAEVVLGAGRGFAEQEDLQLLETLASKMGGECGCTRPLAEGVDWMPRETYIGVSGLMLSPKVYVACGISGQMQHMVGCNRAQTLFAINKDKNAPIFKQCDYGLVGTIKEALPALIAAWDR